MSEDDTEDSNESDTSALSFSSESDEPINNRQLCTKTGRQWNDITFLNNRWKRNYPGHTVRGFKPPTCTRRKVSKYVKYRVITMYH